MKEYYVPIRYLPYEQQIKAARLLHLLVSFLMMSNAWTAFQQATPPLLFIVVQIALSILVFVFAISGKKLTPDRKRMNTVFRLMEIIGITYAAWHFLTVVNIFITGSLQIATLAGLIYLLMSERFIYNPVRITLNEKGIHLPGATKKIVLAWTSVENMRIRNDYISINTKDNRFLQYEINEVLSDEYLDEMNAWCRNHFAHIED